MKRILKNFKNNQFNKKEKTKNEKYFKIYIFFK